MSNGCSRTARSFCRSTTRRRPGSQIPATTRSMERGRSSGSFSENCRIHWPICCWPGRSRMERPCGSRSRMVGSPSMAPDWLRRLREDGDCHRAGIRVRKKQKQLNEVMMAHSNVDEAVATEAVDVATLVAENASLRDRLLRALADAENTRRRAERAAEEARKYAVADFARELLAVADNLQRTIAGASRHSPEKVEDEALIEGVRATDRLPEHTFSRFGIQKIDARGKPFDPTLHEAMMEVDDPSQPPGAVVRVAEDGYKIHDRLLRP